MKIETLSTSESPQVFLERFCELGSTSLPYLQGLVNLFPEVEKELFIISESERVIGRILINISQAKERCGFFSFFEVDLKRSDKDELARELFQQAEKWLAMRGKKEVFGPIELNVWMGNRYRVDEGKVTLPWEPGQPRCYLDFLRDNDYVQDMGYITELHSGCTPLLERGAVAYERFLKQGFSMVPVNISKPETASELYRINTLGFIENYLYELISFEQYQAFHITAVKSGDLRFTFFVQDPAGVKRGYVYAYPYQDYITIKSIVVDPKAQGTGVATALLYHAIKAAQDNGYKKVIGSTMRKDNISTKWTKYSDGVEETHEYYLFKKELK